MKNSISFFIPAYNCEHTVEESIRSILNTNFNADDELIIVNDCSSDQTGVVLNKCQQEYPFIKIINHSRNKGGAAARNTAVENTKNELLFCLDSDNILNANTILPLKKYLLEQHADVASFEEQHFFSKSTKEIHYVWKLPIGAIPLDHFLNGNNTPGQHGNYLFTKQSWLKAGGYAEGVGALDTLTFGLRQAITEAKFVVLEGTNYFHRLQDTSYYINDAHQKMWSVPLKVTFALLPFFNRIDEDYISYMFENRYTWFYEIEKNPIKLVDEHSKNKVYEKLQKDLTARVYPKRSLYKRGYQKLLNLIKARF